jgi:hypothetical protein
LDYNKFMLWFRKGFVYFLSVVLLISLVGMAFATSFNQTVGQPKKVETMLSQSKLYDHFVAYTADQAKKSAGDSDQSGAVSLSDAAVQAAAKSAFSPQLIQQGVNAFLDSNYAWLQGKTATPNFTIDLSAQKQTFAQQVGQYVKTYTAGLPVCTDAAAQQQGTDLLAATCRPAALTPEAAGAQVTQQLTTSGDFLSNPVITANSINPKSTPQSKPYYQKLSRLPQLYRIVTKLPLILGVLSIISALGIIFIDPPRRKGVRRVGTTLLAAAIILVSMKFISDFIFKKLERKVFNSNSVGQLQQSLTDFAHRVESSLVKTDLIFGIAFLLLGLVILGILFKTRQKSGKPKVPGGSADSSQSDSEKPPIVISRTPRSRLGRDSIMPLGAKPADKPEEPAAPPPKRKKPRLIQ